MGVAGDAKGLIARVGSLMSWLHACGNEVHWAACARRSIHLNLPGSQVKSIGYSVADT